MWLFENVLTHPSSMHTCIDPFTGNEEQSREDVEGMYVKYISKMVDYIERLEIVQEKSNVGLIQPSVRAQRYDFIYIDGDHRSWAALEDAILSFRLLNVNGIMIFDDYWAQQVNSNDLNQAKAGVDAFLSIYSGYYSIVRYNYQISIQKIGDLP